MLSNKKELGNTKVTTDILFIAILYHRMPSSA